MIWGLVVIPILTQAHLAQEPHQLAQATPPLVESQIVFIHSSRKMQLNILFALFQLFKYLS